MVVRVLSLLGYLELYLINSLTPAVITMKNCIVWVFLRDWLLGQSMHFLYSLLEVCGLLLFLLFPFSLCHEKTKRSRNIQEKLQSYQLLINNSSFMSKWVLNYSKTIKLSKNYSKSCWSYIWWKYKLNFFVFRFSPRLKTYWIWLQTLRVSDTLDKTLHVMNKNFVFCDATKRMNLIYCKNVFNFVDFHIYF